MTTYRLKHLTQTVTYELAGQSLRVTGESLVGKDYEFGFDARQLDPEPYREWSRSEAVRHVWSIALLLVAFAPVVYLGVMGVKVADLQPGRYMRYWVAAIAGCVAGWVLAPRVESVTFRYKSGQPAVAVVRAGSASGNFDGFVAALSEVARGDAVPATTSGLSGDGPVGSNGSA